MPEKLGDPQILFKPKTSTGSGTQVVDIVFGRKVKILSITCSGSAEWSSVKVAVWNHKEGKAGKVLGVFNAILKPTHADTGCTHSWHGITYSDWLLRAQFPAGAAADTYLMKCLVRFVE